MTVELVIARRREEWAYRELAFARAELEGARELHLPEEVILAREAALEAAEAAWSKAHGDVDIEEERGR